MATELEAPRRPLQTDEALRRRYQVDEAPLAIGGMGVVWRAFDTRLRREVAVKSLRRIDRASRRYLSHEAAVMAELDHPGICPLFDKFLTEVPASFCMKLIRGQPLSERLGQAAQDEDLPELVRTLIRLCQILEYAHEQGVVHRDLKPDNVFLGRFGEVYLLDWGLARLSGRDDPFAGRVAGTPGFMAPEQARAAADELGPACDAFGLGAILREVLRASTGQGTGPGTGQGAPAETRASQEPPLTLRGLAPEHATVTSAQARLRAGWRFDPAEFSQAPAELRELCARALHADPAQRPSAAELRAGLEAFLEHRASRQVEQAAWESYVGQQYGSDYRGALDALAGLRQAQALWPDNPDLPAKLQELRLGLARQALAEGSYGLAETQLSELAQENGELPREVAELERRLVAGRRQRTGLVAAAWVLVVSLLVSVPILAAAWRAQATLQISVRPATAQVLVDGVERPDHAGRLVLDPGRHRVEVTAPGHEPWVAELDVSWGAVESVSRLVSEVEEIELVELPNLTLGGDRRVEVSARERARPHEERWRRGPGEALPRVFGHDLSLRFAGRDLDGDRPRSARWLHPGPGEDQHLFVPHRRLQRWAVNLGGLIEVPPALLRQSGRCWVLAGTASRAAANRLSLWLEAPSGAALERTAQTWSEELEGKISAAYLAPIQSQAISNSPPQVLALLDRDDGTELVFGPGVTVSAGGTAAGLDHAPQVFAQLGYWPLPVDGGWLQVWPGCPGRVERHDLGLGPLHKGFGTICFDDEVWLAALYQHPTREKSSQALVLQLERERPPRVSVHPELPLAPGVAPTWLPRDPALPLLLLTESNYSEKTAQLRFLDPSERSPQLSPAQELRFDSSLRAPPRCHDLDGDGRPEIVLRSGTELVILEGGPTRLRERWRRRLSSFASSRPLVADLDRDGLPEIVVASGDGQVRCFDPAGLLRWSFRCDGAINAAPLARDADGDGQLEVLVAGWGGELRCLQPNGPARASVGSVVQGVSLADLDGDGALEVLAGAIPPGAGTLAIVSPGDPDPLSFAMPDSGEVRARPYVVPAAAGEQGDTVLVASRGGTVARLALTTDRRIQPRWVRRLNPASFHQPPLIRPQTARELLLFEEHSGQAWLLDLASGSETRAPQRSALEEPLVQEAAFCPPEDLLVVTSTTQLDVMALDAPLDPSAPPPASTLRRLGPELEERWTLRFASERLGGAASGRALLEATGLPVWATSWGGALLGIADSGDSARVAARLELGAPANGRPLLLLPPGQAPLLLVSTWDGVAVVAVGPERPPRLVARYRPGERFFAAPVAWPGRPELALVVTRDGELSLISCANPAAPRELWRGRAAKGDARQLVTGAPLIASLRGRPERLDVAVGTWGNAATQGPGEVVILTPVWEE